MEPRLLFNELIRRSGKNANALAKEMRGQSFQGTLSRFLSGQTPVPTRATAMCIADHWKLPIEAVYDPDVAERIAREIGFTAPITQPSLDPVPVVAEPKVAYTSSRVTRSLLDRIERLSHEQWGTLLGVIEGYLNSVQPASSSKARRA